jgi:hypothetical protein
VGVHRSGELAHPLHMDDLFDDESWGEPSPARPSLPKRARDPPRRGAVAKRGRGVLLSSSGLAAISPRRPAKPVKHYADDDVSMSPSLSPDESEEAPPKRAKPSRAASSHSDSDSELEVVVAASSSAARRTKKPAQRGARGRRPSHNPEDDMAGVEALAERVQRELSEAAGGKQITLEDLGIGDVTEVRELPPPDVLASIEGVFAEAADSIMSGQSFSFMVPNRASSNQLYVPELDRIVLKAKTSSRSFNSTSQVRKTTIMTRVMEMLHQVLRRNIHTTKRDLFYADVKLFRSQDESDAVLDDVACMVGCTRTSLHVVASEKGVVVGRLSFREGE